MSDDETQAGGQDRTRINTGGDYEVREKKLGVALGKLLAAVKAIGSDAAAGEAHVTAGKR